MPVAVDSPLMAEADAQAFGTDLSMVQQRRGFYTSPERIEGAVSTEEALRMAGLDFEVIQEPVHDAKGRVIPGFKRNTRADDDSVNFGIVTARFKPIQNRDAFAMCDEFVKNGYGWEAGGITQHGGFAWGILAFQDDWTVAGEPMDKKLLFINSHKGDRSLTLGLTPLRPACTNALGLSSGGGRNLQARHRIQHTGDTTGKIEEAMALLGASGEYFDVFGRLADKLATQKVSKRRLDKWLEVLYPSGTTDTGAKSPAERAEAVRALLTGGDNLANHRDNAWGFLNAVGERADWGSTRGRDHMARLCGDSDTPEKNRALHVVMGDLGLSLN